MDRQTDGQTDRFAIFIEYATNAISISRVSNQYADARSKSSDFHEILYTAAYFELGERHVIKIENVALDRLRV